MILFLNAFRASCTGYLSGHGIEHNVVKIKTYLNLCVQAIDDRSSIVNSPFGKLVKRGNIVLIVYKILLKTRTPCAKAGRK